MGRTVRSISSLSDNHSNSFQVAVRVARHPPATDPPHPAHCVFLRPLTQKVSVVPELSEECYITDDNLFTFFLRSGDIRFVW